MSNKNTTNIIETWKKLSVLTVNTCEDIDNVLQEQILRLDVIYNNILQIAQEDLTVNLLDKKTSNNVSKEKNEQHVDLFSSEPGFQPLPVSCTLKRQSQASMDIDDRYLKAAQKQEQLNILEGKIEKAVGKNKRKEEKGKAEEILFKKEILKKHKLAEFRIETNTYCKLADEEELKKLIENNENDFNDYGLNEISACDSSDDESNPKKSVPSWAKKENRKAVLELQYHINVEQRDLFFNCPKSMNFSKMFNGWNIRDKKRTSSAVWNTPPKF